MYCIRCGVELADSETRCPLCDTRVVHPDLELPKGEKPFPDRSVETRTGMSKMGVLFLITIGFAVASLVMLECDLNLTGRPDWSEIAIGGLVLAYVSAVLPNWFQKANPVIFVPCAFATAMVYEWVICMVVGGSWFWNFALPITMAVTLVTVAAVTLYRYLSRGYLYITGGLLMSIGGIAVLIEWLLYCSFGIATTFPWSMYPLTALLLFGMAVIVIAISKPLRRSLHKKFFL